MKNRWVTLVVLGLSLQSFAQMNDTTIRGVYVGFDYSPAIFPVSWQSDPVRATGVPIIPAEIARSKKAMVRTLAKYPASLLKRELQKVYFLRQMSFYRVGFGGTNSADAVYLTNEGVQLGFTDKYLEQTFHHEFSSILIRNHPAWLDTIAWKEANSPEFNYNDPENGVGAIRNNASSQELDSVLATGGLLTQYGGSSLENDVNTFAQNLFCPAPGFWSYVDRFPRIRKKVNVLIRFYGRLSPQFTESFFRNLK